MLIQGEDAHQTITEVRRERRARPARARRRVRGRSDPFDEFRVTEQIEKALDRKVWLPSGGSLVIDRTEAMTVVDVNTGKFVGIGRQPRRDRHEEQPRGRRRDRPPAAAARHRRHHRRRLHRHGARVQPRPRAAPPGRVPEPRPHEAPGRRGDLARPRADDPQEARPRAARDVQRGVRGLRRTRRHRAPRPRREAPRARSAAAASADRRPRARRAADDVRQRPTART